MITDLTEGNINRKLWAFSLPMLLSVMFQQIYNIADSMIAGRFIGEGALAAVGASYPITMIFIAVAMGSNIGCSVVISQLFGAKKLQDMKTAISTTFIFCAVLSISLTILGLVFSRQVMNLIHTPADIFHDASVYLNIYIAGLVFLFFYNICTGIFNALGDSRTPLYFLIGSSVANVILALLFVIVFHLGVAGTALATLIAQGVSAVLAILTLLKRLRALEVEGESKIFSGAMLLKICLISIPSILQQSFISIGNMWIQSIVNGYGTSVIAGYNAAIRLITFAIASFATMANGISSFTAQNIGAGKADRVSKGLGSGILMGECIAVPAFLLLFFFDEPLLHLFLRSDSVEAMHTGVTLIHMAAPFFAVIAIKLMIDGVLRGAGAMGWFMIATFADLIVRVAISLYISGTYHTSDIWISWPIGWTLAMILSAIFYLSGVWKKRIRYITE